MTISRIRTRIITYAIVILITLGFVMTVFIHGSLSKLLRKELQQKGVFIAKNYASHALTPMLTENLQSLQLEAFEIKNSSEEIEYAYIMDATKHVLAHTFDNSFPVDLKSANPIAPGETYRIQALLTERGIIYDVAAPVGDGHLGNVHIGLSDAKIRSTIFGISEILISIIAGVILISIIISIVFFTAATRTISELTKAIDSVKKGDMSSRIAIRSRDEIGLLADTFNTMLDSLQRTTVSKEYVESILRNMNECVIVTDAAGTITTTNPTADTLLGYGTGELTGMNFDTVCADPRTMPVIIERGIITNLEKQYVTRTGRTIPVLLSSTVMRANGGEIQGIIVVATDITSLKKVEEELDNYRIHLEKLVEKRTFQLMEANASLTQEISEKKRAEHTLAAYTEKLSATLRNIGEGVISTDSTGAVQLMNNSAETLTGWTQKEAEGRPLADIYRIHNERTEQPVTSSLEALLNAREPEDPHGIKMLLRRNGKKLSVSETASVIHDSDGNIEGAVLVFKDVSDRRKTEEELLRREKLESLALLAGGIAHDFNNLLTGILGNITLSIFHSEDKEKLLGRLSKAEKAATQAKGLTRQLLDFAKGGVPVKKPEAVAELVRESVSFATTGSAVRTVFDLPKDLWTADIDAGQINQVIHNITVNAIHSMNGNGIFTVSAQNIIVEIGTQLPVRPGRYIKLSFRDTGHGIGPEQIEKIFDPYFTTKETGFGLGLATVFSIVKKHSGHIAVESQGNEGTAFNIYLPASDQPAAVEAKESISAPSRGTGKVLIIDDNETIRDIAAEVLTNKGYETATVSNGTEAFNLFKTAFDAGRPFDVVITDMIIPGESGGIDIIKRFKAVHPAVKAIISTGISTSPVIDRFANYGFDAAVVKPYLPNQLCQTVYRVISADKFR